MDGRDARVNPYASPEASLTPPPIVRTSGDLDYEGVWRDGRKLVVRQLARLPDVCVKTNQPANGHRLMRRYSWHHPGWFATVLLGVLVYVIVSFVVRRSATVSLALCQEAINRRTRNLMIGWVIVILAIAVIALGAVFLNDESARLGLIWLGIILTVVGIVIVSRAAAVLNVSRIANGYIWLSGANLDYLLALPEWGRDRINVPAIQTPAGTSDVNPPSQFAGETFPRIRI